MKPWKVEESKASCHAHLNNKRHKKKPNLAFRSTVSKVPFMSVVGVPQRSGKSHVSAMHLHR
jgi:predicted GTPase